QARHCFLHVAEEVLLEPRERDRIAATASTGQVEVARMQLAERRDVASLDLSQALGHVRHEVDVGDFDPRPCLPGVCDELVEQLVETLGLLEGAAWTRREPTEKKMTPGRLVGHSVAHAIIGPLAVGPKSWPVLMPTRFSIL